MSDTSLAFDRQRDDAAARYQDELARISEAEEMVTQAEDGHMSRVEFATAIGWSQRHVDQLLAERKLPGALKVSGRVLIPRRLVAHPEEIGR